MKCPYCKKEMNSGVIVSGRDNPIFIPDNAKKKFGIFYENIKLTSFLDGKVEAMYCEICQKIIIDIKK